MFSICSTVCACSNAENATLKLDTSVITGHGNQQGFLGKSRSILMLDPKENAADSNVFAISANMTEAPEATPECATASEFPTPQQLIKMVISPSQIFGVALHEICVFGSSVDGRKRKAQIEPDYEEKKLEISGANGPDDLRNALAALGIGICCKKAKKPMQPNQDNIFLCKMGKITFCGVADGHGPDGHWVSHWVARFVVRLLMAEIGATGIPPADDVLTKIFDLVHRSLRECSKATGFDVDMSGSTLTVCIIDHQAKAVTAAWVGDSSCAVGKLGAYDGQSLTKDHKPQNKLEKQRIEANGGEVTRMEGDVPYRIFVKKSQGPGLAMSRAVGDGIAHTIGVIHRPEIVRYKVEDHFLLCCSDGVWEFMEARDACQIVDKMGRGRVGDSMEALALEARTRWLKEEEVVTDDISCIGLYI